MDELELLIENLNDQIDFYKKSAQQWSEIATLCLSKMTEFSASFPSSSDMFFSAHNGSSDAFSLSKNSEGIVVGLLLERGEPIPLECTSDSRVLSKWCGDFVEDADEMAKESQKRGLAGFPSFLIELSGMPACSKVYQ